MKAKKILTFSYDDGVKQDARLAELFHKYGMRATFNLNSELLGRDGELICGGVKVCHDKLSPSDVRSVYEGHEVAAHTLTHPLLPSIENDDEIVRQVECDRLRLSELAGYEVVGFAYPCGGKNCDERVADIIKGRTGIKYARTIVSSLSFEKQENLFEFLPTVHHTDFDTLFSLGEKFLASTPEHDEIFYVWGHSYEFDADDSWGRFEEFLRMMSGKSDILYLTNREALLAQG